MFGGDNHSFTFNQMMMARRYANASAPDPLHSFEKAFDAGKSIADKMGPIFEPVREPGVFDLAGVAENYSKILGPDHPLVQNIYEKIGKLSGFPYESAHAKKQKAFDAAIEGLSEDNQLNPKVLKTLSTLGRAGLLSPTDLVNNAIQAASKSTEAEGHMAAEQARAEREMALWRYRLGEQAKIAEMEERGRNARDRAKGVGSQREKAEMPPLSALIPKAAPKQAGFFDNLMKRFGR